jgi:predicted AAA+ superfamily ATPase
LEPFHLSVRKRQTARSKFYFFDTGVVRALQNRVGEPLAPSSYEYGDLFETFMVNEFIKLRTATSLRWSFSYLRTKGDHEIDMIVEKPRGKPLLIEFKSGQRVDHEDLTSLSRLSRDIEHEQVYLLSNSTSEVETDGIRCLHWKKGLKEIFDLP